MENSSHRVLRILSAVLWLVLVFMAFVTGIVNAPGETAVISFVVIVIYLFWGIAQSQEDLTIPFAPGRVVALTILSGLSLGFLGVGYSLGVLDFLRANQEFMEMTLVMAGLIFACISGGITAVSLRDEPAYKALSKLIRNHVISLLIGGFIMLFMFIVTSSRDEKFAGMAAGLGLFATLVALIWVLGAGIMGMFLREKYDLQMAAKTPPKQPQASFLDEDPLPLM